MIESTVPVSMGSPNFGTWQAESALVTWVSFPPRAVLEPHVHDRSTFAVVLAGGFDIVFPSRRTRPSLLSCPTGTILMQPAGEKHVNRIGADGARGVVLQPDVATPKLPGRCARMLDGIHHFHDGLIAAAARRLAREIAAPDDVTPLVVEGLILEMLAEAGRLQDKAGVGGSSPPPWLSVVTELVHERFRQGVRIDEVAAAAGVHPAHLANVFRRFHRLSLGAYVRRLRIDWAADQLVGTDTSVALIAAEAGFADQAHLTRWFRRMTGWSPANYRRVRRRQ